MFTDAAIVVAELDDLLAQWEQLRRSTRHSDCSDKPHESVTLVTLMAAAIDRYAPPGSVYRQHGPILPAHISLEALPGIVHALRKDYDAGRMRTLSELVHADVFGDFLEMAQHLVEEGYKNPSAVLAGGVLEEHLRKLAVKNGIPVQDTNGRPKKASVLNAELKKASVYTTGDEKNVTAWLDLRNNAAHGHYTLYTSERVELLIASIRHFVTVFPA